MGNIIGMIGVTICVIVGFVGPGGPLPVLVQPFELLVIGGSAVFTLIGGATSATFKCIVNGFKAMLKGGTVKMFK